jgi:hypothetical protein
MMAIAGVLRLYGGIGVPIEDDGGAEGEGQLVLAGGIVDVDGDLISVSHSYIHFFAAHREEPFVEFHQLQAALTVRRR